MGDGRKGKHKCWKQSLEAAMKQRGAAVNAHAGVETPLPTGKRKPEICQTNYDKHRRTESCQHTQASRQSIPADFVPQARDFDRQT